MRELHVIMGHYLVVLFLNYKCLTVSQLKLTMDCTYIHTMDVMDVIIFYSR